MKLPCQAQPVMRNVSPVRIYGNQAKYVKGSDCNSDCAWVVGACTFSLAGGYVAYAACLAAAAASSPSCRDCVEDFAKAYWDSPGCRGPRCHQ
jgi:hypothetical protein